MKWQPIATAPRDGRAFLGLLGRSAITMKWRIEPDTTKTISRGFWPFRSHRTVFEAGWQGFSWVFDLGNGVTGIMHIRTEAKVTHWMPLPEPPDVSAETEAAR